MSQTKPSENLFYSTFADQDVEQYDWGVWSFKKDFAGRQDSGDG